MKMPSRFLPPTPSTRKQSREHTLSPKDEVDQNLSTPNTSLDTSNTLWSRRKSISLISTGLLFGIGGNIVASVTRRAYGQDRPISQSVLKVVTTTEMLADPLRNLFPEGIVIRSLMGSGVDPHFYTPVRKDVELMIDADVIIYNGFNLEAQMSEVLDQMSKQKMVINACETFAKDDAIAVANNTYDPHLWTDPQLWTKVINGIRNRLIDAFNLSDIAPSPEAYNEKLQRLVSYGHETLSSITQNRNLVVTPHVAFAYMSRQFGFTNIGIKGISTQSEAGIFRIRRIAEHIYNNDIKMVFTETSSSTSEMQAVINILRQQGRRVLLGPALYSDAMASPSSYESTYIGMQDHNITAIALGLGGLAPARGMNGILSKRLPNAYA